MQIEDLWCTGMEARPRPGENALPASDAQVPWDERAERIAGLASQHGLRYLPSYPSQDPCGIEDAPFRWMKRRPELSNVLCGSYQGTEIIAFDYVRYGAVLTGGAEGGSGSVGSYLATASCALAKVSTSAPRVTIVPWEDMGPFRRLLRVGRIRLGDPRFRRIFHV